MPAVTRVRTLARTGRRRPRTDQPAAARSRGLIPAAAYLSLHAVESNAVTPAVLGARFTMNPVMILLALSYFSWIWGVTGALLSVPILLTITALFDHLGKPNVVGFLFGEPLFDDRLPDAEEEHAH